MFIERRNRYPTLVLDPGQGDYSSILHLPKYKLTTQSSGQVWVQEEAVVTMDQVFTI